MTDDDDQQPRKCRWCSGRGYEWMDGGRVQWWCPDCAGTGIEQQEEEEEEDE